MRGNLVKLLLGDDMSAPKSNMASVANLWLRQMHFIDVGDKNEGHRHDYDHVTLLAKGSVEVDVEGHKTIFRAPHMIYIVAGKSHYLTALEPDTVAYCVHALKEPEATLLDSNMIPSGVDPRTVA